MTRAVIAAAAAAWPITAGAADDELELQLPVECEIGRDCFIQQYVDNDPGPGFKDYTCGKQSYDGHKGTDIRVRTTADVARGVAVVAAAGGIVKGRRDGMADELVKGRQRPASIKGRECGNGVVIAHPGGWETQYCHMKRGSIRVRKGDVVKAGDLLGEVGYSGLAGFAHIHLSVRKDGEIVDPFKGLVADRQSCGEGDAPLWTRPVLQALAYQQGQVLDAGFAGGKIALKDVEAGKVQGFEPSPESPALVAWGWAMNLQKGDEVIAVLKGPKGALSRNKVTLKTSKSQYMLFAGKKRTAARWPGGRYVAMFGVLRAGEPIMRAARPFVMR